MESIITSTQLIRIHVLAVICCNKMIIVNVTINKPFQRWSDIIKTLVFNAKRKRSLDKISLAKMLFSYHYQVWKCSLLWTFGVYIKLNTVKEIISTIRLKRYVEFQYIFIFVYTFASPPLLSATYMYSFKVYLYLCPYICLPPPRLLFAINIYSFKAGSILETGSWCYWSSKVFKKRLINA